MATDTKVGPNYTYSASLDRIIDGDTIEATIDLGHSVFMKRTLRLLGYDSPEIRTRDDQEKVAGLEAKKFLESILTKNLVVRTVKKDSFGRWLSEVWYQSADEWVSVSESMIKHGYIKHT